jgi:uncharacterized surface protein with fasciclin (FAS1) repeats
MKTLTIYRHWPLLMVSKLAIFLAIIVLLGSCQKDPFSYQEKNRQILMLDQIKQDTSLSIAVEALEIAKMDATLNTYGPFTFFAPDNAAFRKYFKNQGKKSIKDYSQEELKTLMTYHILPTRLVAAQFIQGPQATATGRGDYITLDISKGYKSTALANGKATVYQTDLEFANGFLHKMDGVLDPPTLTIGEFMKQNPDKYSVMTAGLERIGMMDTLINLTDASGARIRLTLFAETNEVLQKAGITSFASVPLPELKAYMRYHIVRGGNFSASYTFLTTGISAINVAERWDNTLSTLDGQKWIYFDLAAPKLINNATISFEASDIIMRNGILHNIDKQMLFSPDIRRTQIYHIFAANLAYGYGIPSFSNGAVPVIGATAGNWRTYGESANPALSRGTIQMLFAGTDGIGDSIISVVKGVRPGKYRFEINYKSGGRGDFQMKYQEDNIGSPINYGTKPPNWPNDFQQKIVVGTYEFKTGGDKRIKFVCTRAGSINLDCMVLTPQY